MMMLSEHVLHTAPWNSQLRFWRVEFREICACVSQSTEKMFGPKFVPLNGLFSLFLL
jgi:hypothetical protein